MPPKPDPGRQRGFTLIELIIVLVILGLMISIVLVRGPLSNQSLTTKEAASELAGALREARSRAIGNDEPVRLAVNLRARTFQIGDRLPEKIPAGLAISVLTTAGELRRGDLADIRFNPDGSSNGGRIVLANGRRKTEIGVDWLTGRVRVVDVP